MKTGDETAQKKRVGKHGDGRKKLIPQGKSEVKRQGVRVKLQGKRKDSADKDGLVADTDPKEEPLDMKDAQPPQGVKRKTPPELSCFRTSYVAGIKRIIIRLSADDA